MSEPRRRRKEDKYYVSESSSWISTKLKDKDKHSRPSRKVRTSSSKEGSSHRGSRGTALVAPEERGGEETARGEAEEEEEKGKVEARGVKQEGREKMERWPSDPSLTDSAVRKNTYPTFSKAHSKEIIGSREDILNRSKNMPFTPDPTDLASQQETFALDPGGKEMRGMGGVAGAAGAAPPSPPLTATEPPDPASTMNKKEGWNIMMNSAAEDAREDMQRGRKSTEEGYKYGTSPRATASRSSLPAKAESAERLQGSLGHVDKSKYDDSPSSSSKTKKKEKKHRKRGESPLKKKKISARLVSGKESKSSSLLSRQMTDSDATYVAPERRTLRKPPLYHSNRDSSPSSRIDSSPQTPTQPDMRGFPAETDRKGSPMLELFRTDESAAPPQSTAMPEPPPPPPPPPPPMMSFAEVPQVDYLLLNGGLTNTVPRNLLAALEDPSNIPTYQSYASPRNGPQRNYNIQKIFAPFQDILDNYNKVLAKRGSVAVATGYRSVARRLLDRLENVFARDISSEVCSCVMCKLKRQTLPDEEETGVGWGEILEYVSGRRELPQWPPFAISKVADGLGVTGLEPSTPMQKLDIDIPEEYQAHYVRQSKKTKQTVQNWLTSQPDLPSSPPQEVDDDTLTFAMLTHLEPESRRVFTALMRDMSTLPLSRAPTPLERPKCELLEKTALALQRLYRLQRRPRDPECAIYLLQSPELHGILATLAAVSAGEWDILVSGRFDGFLWGGVENTYSNPRATPSHPYRAEPRGPAVQSPMTPYSRTTTPYKGNGNANITPSRGATPSVSRTTTPYHHQQQQYPYTNEIHRKQTPAATATTSTASPSGVGAPVQIDEETELAVLAEVEREIFMGMEALEDAFESLHCKAEGVRRTLRERSAAMAMAAQARRGPGAETVEARMDTPAFTGQGYGQGYGYGGGAGAGARIGTPGYGGVGTGIGLGVGARSGTPCNIGGYAAGGYSSRIGTPWEAETDDGLDDIRSEILPDDSASNISTSRRRRPERRHERKTPALVEEANEEG